MYSRDEAKSIRESFWTSFGQYMTPILGAEGQKVNWVNYKTGVKHLFFRMDVDNKKAFIAIEMAHPDAGIRSLMFEQFLQYKMVLESELAEEWVWHEQCYDNYGKETARIYMELSDVSIFRRDDWPSLISFFKPRIIALDSFWSDAQYGFELFK
ncbi:DUF4268 domain-containing protein [Sphingobacteruim zhuxiongii]|nr:MULTISPECIES: DUF4268 domain-containing protein [unclassified Sphingobacterium]